MIALRWTKHADLAIRRRPTVGREEYLDHMTFQRNDRPLLTEIFGPLVGLKEEWLDQGATPEELDFSAFRYRCPENAWVRANTGFAGPGRHEVLEETDEHEIYRDGLGRTMKLHKGVATLALPLDYPVRTEDDWLRLRPAFAFREDRLAPGWAETARADLAAGRVLGIGMPGAFAMPRELMGDEALCLAFYEQPELVRDMLQTFGDTCVAVLERLAGQVRIDVLSVHEDLAGKSGPLVGPTQVAEFFRPYYRRVWDAARACGARLFDQDSDGDVAPVLDAFLDGGVNVFHPVEPCSAAMDVVALRGRYGRRFAFYGGIDKHVLRRSREEIAAEVERKVPPLLPTGGCMFGLDHRIPNGTPLANYRYYLDKIWEAFGEPSR